MPPRSANLGTQFMDMRIIANKDDLLGVACRPAITSRKHESRGCSGERGQVCLLPVASHRDPEFMNVTCRTNVGHLFGPSFRPRVAHEESANRQGGTGLCGQICLLPYPADTHVKLANITILADISNLL